MVEKSWGRHCREGPQGSTLSWTTLRPVLTAVPEVMVGPGHQIQSQWGRDTTTQPPPRNKGHWSLPSAPHSSRPYEFETPQTPSTICGPFWLFENGVGGCLSTWAIQRGLNRALGNSHSAGPSLSNGGAGATRRTLAVPVAPRAGHPVMPPKVNKVLTQAQAPQAGRGSAPGQRPSPASSVA